MKKVERYTIYLPSETHTELKVYAARTKVPMSEIIIELIIGFLKGKQK